MRETRGFTKKSCCLCFVCLLITGIIALSLGLAIPTWLRKPDAQALQFNPNTSLGRIMANMDTSQDPCEDFYEFACGGYEKRTTIPDESFQASTNEEIQNLIKRQVKELLEEPTTPLELSAFTKTKDFFASCMDMDRIETKGSDPLLRLMSDLGGWPVLRGPDWVPTHKEFTDLVSAFTKKGLVADFLFQFGTMKNVYDEAKFILYMAPPAKLGLPISWYFGKNNPVMEPYFRYMVETASTLGANTELAEKDMKDVLELEEAIALLAAKSTTGKVYDKYQTWEINFPPHKINWLDVWSVLLPYNLGYHATILFRDPVYFHKLQDLIAQTPIRVMTNYFFWRVVSTNVRYLDRETARPRFMFETLLSGVQTEPPRFKFCSEETLFFMDVAITSMYVRKYTSTERMKAASMLIDKISNEFQSNLLSMKWMDALTATNARQKVSTMKKMIVFPEEYFENYTIDDFYKDVNISRKGSFFSHALNIKFSAHTRNLMLLNKDVDSDSWTQYSDMIADTGPSYNVLQNALKIPMTFLQGVYFEPSNQKYLNFGAIGSVIGHEHFHSVDLKGGTFTQDGAKKEWWSKNTTVKFYNQSECYIQQYNNYVIPEINETVSGVKTAAENLADHVGAQISYKAYGYWYAQFGPELPPDGLGYSPMEFFWLSYANMYCSKTRVEAMKQIAATDNHAPHRFRVNGPLSNIPEFSRDFKCPLGSPMNPEKKCSII